MLVAFFLENAMEVLTTRLPVVKSNRSQATPWVAFLFAIRVAGRRSPSC